VVAGLDVLLAQELFELAVEGQRAALFGAFHGVLMAPESTQAIHRRGGRARQGSSTRRTP
jgi:hypothetical protein